MKRILLLALALVLLACGAAADTGTADAMSADFCESEEGLFDGEPEEEDAVEDALRDYDGVIRAFVRAVRGASWQREDAQELLDLCGIALEDVNGDGALELLLYSTGEEWDDLCGLYALDGEGKAVDMLPGLCAVYRYTLCTAEDGGFVLRRMSDEGDVVRLETCAYYRLEGQQAVFAEGYICKDGVYCRAQGDAPRVPDGTQTMTQDEVRDMLESCPPYLEEYWFTASVSDYLFVEGDGDAISAWYD